MNKREYAIIVILGLAISASMVLLALRGRYQYGTMGPGWPISHDTWTGKIYQNGTEFVCKEGDNK